MAARPAREDASRGHGRRVRGDLHYLGWALAWQAHALLTDPARFVDGNIYGGAPRALFYGTPGFGLLPLFAPVFAATGDTTLARDVALLASLALTAASIHLVVLAWTRSQAAGMAAAATFLVSPGALTLCGTAPQYAALAPTAPIVWLLAQERLTRRRTIALAALVAAQMATDVIYVAAPLVLTVGVVALLRLARRGSRADGVRMVGALVAAGCAVLPLYAGYLAVRAANPDLAHQTVWNGARRLWMNPSTLLPAGNEPLSVDLLVFVPVAVGGLAVAVRGTSPALARAWRQAALWFAVVFAIAWALPVTIPAVRDLIVATRIRDIARLGFPALVALCLLVGLGVSACADAVAAHVPARLACAVPIAVLALWLPTRIAHLPCSLGDFPVAPAPVAGPEADVLRRRTGPVLELPIGPLDSDTESHAAAMYRSTAHWAPLLNGYWSYYPQGFRERMVLARQLPRRSALAVLRRETGLSSVVVHSAGMPNLTIGPWRAAIDSGQLPGVHIEYVDADVLVASLD